MTKRKICKESIKEYFCNKERRKEKKRRRRRNQNEKLQLEGLSLQGGKKERICIRNSGVRDILNRTRLDNHVPFEIFLAVRSVKRTTPLNLRRGKRILYSATEMKIFVYLNK